MAGKAKKAETGGGVTSQPPRGAATNQQRLGDAQRLRAGVGQQASLPKQGKWWILELISWDREQYSKLNCPTLLGEELTRFAPEG
jgi:hypothetical protein